MLYDLCARFPRHELVEDIVAKVWLIGRSYAAPIERGKLDALSSDDFYPRRVAPMVMGSRLDEHLNQIAPKRDCRTVDDARLALAVHDALTTAFRRASGRANRSLSSKYLHFHRPHFFPIYDSRASSQIRRMVVGRVPRGFPPGDQEYRSFMARYLALAAWIREKDGADMSPRQIDRLLLRY